MLKDKYGYNNPIFTEDLSHCEHDELLSLITLGKVKLFEEGIYFFFRKRSRGDSMINPYPIIERRFLTGANGFFSGATLRNRSGVSTQMPNLIELTSNNEVEEVSYVNVGHCLVKAHRAPIQISQDNVNALQFLDLLNSVSGWDLDDYERANLYMFKEKLGISVEALQPYLNLYPNACLTVKEVDLV